MIQLFSYLLSSLLISLIGIGLFLFFFRGLTFFKTNRIYLLLVIALSIFLPILPFLGKLLPDFSAKHPLPTISGSFSVASIIPAEPALDSASGFGIHQIYWILLTILILGSLFFLTKLIRQFKTIQKIKRHSQEINISDDDLNDNQTLKSLMMDTLLKKVHVYDTALPIAPFTFLSNIILNRNQYTEIQLSNILIHELIHVRQHHAFDILFSEFYKTIFWFNPASWLLARFIKEHIENQADQLAIESGISRKAYQYALLQVNQKNKSLNLSINFNYQNLKNRIKMMNKTRTTKTAGWRYLAILTLCAPLFLMQSPKSYAQNQKTPETKAQLTVRPTGQVIDENSPAYKETLVWKKVFRAICSQYGILHLWEIPGLPSSDTIEIMSPVTGEWYQDFPSDTTVGYSLDEIGFEINKQPATLEQMRQLRNSQIRGYGIIDGKDLVGRKGAAGKKVLLFVEI